MDEYKVRPPNVYFTNLCLFGSLALRYNTNARVANVENFNSRSPGSPMRLYISAPTGLASLFIPMGDRDIIKMVVE